MRFVPSSYLRPGMITGRDLYGFNNELMLAEGHELTAAEIRRINLLKYQGIFIIDELTKEIDTNDIIDERLRNNTVRSIKDIFKQAEHGVISKDNITSLKNMIDDVIDEITINNDVLTNIIDLKIFDDYTYYHSVNVFVLSVILGVSMGLNQMDLYNLGLGAILHDIGKVFVPKHILEKKGRLTDEEFEIMKTHSEKGSVYIGHKWEISKDSTLAILTHHEKFNGTGYPYKLRNEKIPLFGKIISVADVYDALTSDRTYRKAMLPSEAVEYIMGGSGIFFDPSIIDVFVKKIIPYPVGTCVKLNSGRTGIVVENYPGNFMRPRIQIIENNEAVSEFLDLYKDKDLLNVTITELASV